MLFIKQNNNNKLTIYKIKNKKSILKLKQSKRQRLKPIILVTQEAEIRRLEVRSQPGQTVRETLSQK
jgi:hypothetical protein